MRILKTQAFTKKTSRLGFTLVELIVVITILVILGTIAFTSLTGFSGNARDSDRVTTLKNIESGLDIHQIKSGSYPAPENITGTGVINNTVLSFVGTIGDTISRIIRINKTPTDPISKTNYVYGTNSSQSQYQIATTLENAITYNTSLIIPTVYADTSLQARVNGNYSGYIKYSSGAETWIANIPSLIFNNTGSTNLFSTGTYFVVNKQQNLPYKIDEKTTTQNKTPNEIIQAITSTQTATLTGVNITGLTAETLTGTFTPEVLASFWWDIAKIETAVLGKSTTVIPQTPNDCTFNSAPVIHNTAVTAYLTGSVSFGQTCTQEQRICTNGTLSGTYTFSACTVAGATGSFTLSQTSVTQWTNPTISNTCSTAPTSYTSSNTAIATVAGTTITTLSVGTTNITPVWGACADSTAKTLTVTSPPFAATGGTITYNGGYTIHTFTTVGTSTFQVTAGSKSVEYLAVGGGGGGGCNNGGGTYTIGGGGGGETIKWSGTLSSGSYTVTVGNGGGGYSGGSYGNGTDGQSSSIAGTPVTLIAFWGQKGFWNDTSNIAGSYGVAGLGASGYGAGGGGASGFGTGGGSSGAAGTGGGGGAGGQGGYSGGGGGGNGSSGTDSNGITHYGGGGGGGARYNGSTDISGGVGALSGYGNGGASAVGGGNGVTNTGNGGKGSGTNGVAAGNGGSGIVIIRYLTN